MIKKIFPNRAIHLDFHTMPGIYDVGRDFDAEDFAQTLVDANVDYITVFARCNIGFAYYPTKVGIVHPGLKRKDLLGPMISACHKRGIRVAAYINAGIDHEHALRHREWVKVTKEGKVYGYQGLGHGFRNMCLNTGYRDHLKAMIREILGKYPVDGLFLDCFALEPCYGTECLEGMKKRGMNIMDDEKVTEFCRIITFKFMDEVQALCARIRKGIYICFNGMPYRLQPKHIELEILPTGGWGYDYLPFCIRYARTLGKPFFTMTGRFHKSWGDFGGLRPKHSLLFDCYNSLANGGTCSIGDHLHPRGRLEKAVYKEVGEVYRAVKQLDPWTDGARALADIAVVYPPFRDFPRPHPRAGYNGASVQGAARMLMELKYQFDVTDGSTDLSKYRVLVLPDNVAVDPQFAKSLRRFLANNGILISSAVSGLNPEKTRFALPEYGLDYKGPSLNNIEFFRAEKEMIAELPEMPITIYSPGIAMQTTKKNCQVLARVIQPYFNVRSWDRFHENLYVPPEKDAGQPALVQCGRVLHFSFPVFSGYFDHAAVTYKTLFRNCLVRVFSDPLVKIKGLPSFGQATVTAQGRQRRIVHFLTYLPELRGESMQIIEEPIIIKNVALMLRRDGYKIRKVYLAPSRERLEFQIRDEYVHVVVPEIRGYQAVVFE